MELHDDDADHLEFALNFIYTLDYDAAAIDKKVGAAQNLRKMMFIMGLYIVADKYDIQRLLAPAEAHFTKIFTAEPSHPILEAVIRAYYTVCTHPGHAIGHAIAIAVLQKHTSFARSSDFRSMCTLFPIFASHIMANVKVHVCCAVTIVSNRNWLEATCTKCGCQKPVIGA